MVNNGYSFLWSNDVKSNTISIRHAEYGVQNWSFGWIKHVKKCAITNQELQVGWLAYFAPAGAPNENAVIGQMGIGHLMNYRGVNK